METSKNYTGKLNKVGKFYLVDSWDVLTSARADYFEAGSEIKSIGVPDNIYGERKRIADSIMLA